MEPEYQTVEQMHKRLLQVIQSRRDTGFLIAVADALLEPRNPFDPTGRRKPKVAVTVTAGLILLLLAVFTYFSLRSAQ